MTLFPIQNLRFSANIHFVSSIIFDGMNLDKTVAPEKWQENWFLEEPQFSVGTCGTRSIGICTGGGVTNQANSAVTHLIPTPYNAAQLETVIRPKLAAALNMLRETKDGVEEKVNSFLIGGHRLDVRQQGVQGPDKDVFTVFRKLKSLFKENGIPVTYFWGSTSDTAVEIYYETSLDTWFVNSQGKDGTIHTVQDLKDRYQFINVALGDRVFIQGREVRYPQAILNKSGPGKKPRPVTRIIPLEEADRSRLQSLLVRGR